MDILGIDIGGSGIKGAPVSTETGQMLALRQRIPTPIPPRPEPIAEVVAQIVKSFELEGPRWLRLSGGHPQRRRLYRGECLKEMDRHRCSRPVRRRHRLPGVCGK